jgi:transcriptional regulator with XRE-family HTH domain
MAISDDFRNRKYEQHNCGKLSAAVVNERKRRGWKQFALADEAGVNERTIQRLERGDKVNQETVGKVMSALRLSPKERPRLGRRKSQRDPWYSSISEAASGLYGEPLGFGHFLRRLPGDALQAACFDEVLLLFITLQAMLIVYGDPNAGIEQDRVTSDAVHTIRMQLILEHLRRHAFVRVRYPRDPFIDIPEVAWWTGHPFVEVLCSLPPEIKEKTMGLILQTGDLSVLMGQMILWPDTEMEDFLQRVGVIDDNISELLEWFETEHGDSQKLAWSEPIQATSGADVS